MTKLALLGGNPVRSKLFPAHNFIGMEEKQKVMEILNSGVLSRFLGVWHDDFYGGDEILAFEREWADNYQAKYGVSVNSCTSGLYAAVGAAAVGPGDEVIVSPYTMVASVTAAIAFNAVPVFADIDPKNFCLNPKSIKERITERTKAIIVVHLFGHPADMDEIMAIADAHNITVIEDCAQAPNAKYKGRPVGTLGHMGVFSLNYHKHIHSGEGGIVLTNDERLADRLCLIRNHAEAVVNGREVDSLVNMVGFNFRLGEIEAGIGRMQLLKSHGLLDKRRRNLDYFNKNLPEIKGLSISKPMDYVEHSYYAAALNYNADQAGLSRKTFLQALHAELPETEMRKGHGPLISGGYVKPIYLYPMFQQQIAYGDKGCPFKCPHYKGEINYSVGICPETEKAHATIITHEYMQPSLEISDIDDVLMAFKKVANNMEALRQFEKNTS
ncbi:MAG: DegT/DnrJ/EryC1/StrS family aminotransferase [Emcibacter sp.]|nr:DegT/DnrJ/EryC1/StrS family aminotransferase [Emcibacter sp.]